MRYVPKFLFVICQLLLSLLIFFPIHGQNNECSSDKNPNDAIEIIENLELDEQELSEQIFRLVVATNITLNDTRSKEIGNIMKKNQAGAVRRFIHNYGTDNTFVGIRSGNFSMTDVAANNTAIGVDSLRRNLSGQRNTAIGKSALTENFSGEGNVAAGYRALRNNTVGAFNVAIGDSALIDFNSVAAASQHTAIGRNALRGLKDGNDNVALGALAGYSASAAGYSGSENVFAGYQAGFSENPGSKNIYIGAQAGSVTVAGTGNIYIGHAGVPGVGLESNAIRIGMSPNQTRCFIAGIYGAQSTFDAVPVVIDSNGQLGIVASSRRFKDDICQMRDESEVVYQLNPVSFVYKNDQIATKQYGLIAEEVNECCPDFVVKGDDGTPYTVRYDLLPVLLLNEINKHHCSIENQKHKMQKQEYAMQEEEVVMQRQDHILQQQSDSIDSLLCAVNDLQKKVHYFMMK